MHTRGPKSAQSFHPQRRKRYRINRIRSIDRGFHPRTTQGTKMTKWTKDVARLIDVAGRGPVIVTLSHSGVTFRYPRKRFTVLVPYATAMHKGEELAARQLANERNASSDRPRKRRASRSLLRGA